MKKNKKHNLSKQIICIIIFLMLCNFIVPNYVYAVDDDDGGDLLIDLAQFLCFIPDVVVESLQKMFVSDEGIQPSDNQYQIKYSPGTIFAGEIPAFNIDFISATNIDYSEFLKQEIEQYIYSNAITQNEYNNKMNIAKNGKGTMISDNSVSLIGEYINSNIFYYVENNKLYVEFFRHYFLTQVDQMGNINQTELWYHYEPAPYDLNDNNVAKQINNAGKKSTAVALQPIIATWYNALRKIAMVGLLSVLVYIGIKILLTSTSANDKAKYKKMLVNWLAAFCILFTIHYIMSITVTIVNSVVEIIKSPTIGANGEDILMSAIRNEIAEADNFGIVIVQVFMYCALMVYTVIFTVQYINRTIHIAFLTLIAPLITLTYPLDKIKDSKSQAFDMWLKDYVFFSLLQVIHILIYYVIVSTSLDASNRGDWFFAIVAIGFITKAEKIVKNMFGFNKSKSMGALQAGATGALVMNIMNKLPKADKGNTNNLLTGSLELMGAASFGMIAGAATLIDGNVGNAIPGAYLGAQTGRKVVRAGVNTFSKKK